MKELEKFVLWITLGNAELVNEEGQSKWMVDDTGDILTFDELKEYYDKLLLQ